MPFSYQIVLNNFSLSLHIQAESYVIQIIRKFLLYISPWIRIEKIKGYDKNFQIYLKPLSKPSVRLLGGGNKIVKEEIRNKDEFIIWSSWDGSFLKTDLRKKIAYGELGKNEVIGISILRRWFETFVFLNNCIFLHSANIKVKNTLSTLLIIGDSGSGKSTLSSLIRNYFHFKVIDDDITGLLDFKKIYSFSIRFISSLGNFLEVEALKLEPIGIPKFILFVERKKTMSKLCRLTSKEAFKRVCFFAEFSSFDNKMFEHKVKILDKLINQCNCFLLINGKDISKDPSKLISLFSYII